MIINVKGINVQIDVESIDIINRRKLFFCRGYLCLYLNGKTVGFHRLVANTPKGLFTDHINGDILDNRKCNLRICSRQQNMCNRKTQKSHSGFKGVHWDKEKKKYRVRVMLNNKRISLGYYKNTYDAAIAYNKGAIKYHGEFARLNIV